jgi:hypothetical protein
MMNVPTPFRSLAIPLDPAVLAPLRGVALAVSILAATSGLSVEARDNTGTRAASRISTRAYRRHFREQQQGMKEHRASPRHRGQLAEVGRLLRRRNARWAPGLQPGEEDVELHEQAADEDGGARSKPGSASMSHLGEISP